MATSRTRRTHGENPERSLPRNEEDYRQETAGLAANLLSAGYTLGNYANYEDLEESISGEDVDGEKLFDDHWVQKSIAASMFTFRDEQLVNLDELAHYLRVGVDHEVLTNDLLEEVLQRASRAELVDLDYYNREKFSLLLQDLFIRDEIPEDLYYGAQEALEMFESDTDWQRTLAERVTMTQQENTTEASVIVGSSIYRLVEAKEPEDSTEETPEDSTEDGLAKDEEPSQQQKLKNTLDVTTTRIEDDLNEAKLKASEPQISGSHEGVRYVTEVEPAGALDGASSILTFDFGNSLFKDVIDKDWDRAIQSLQQLGDYGNITQVVWNYQGNQMVGSVPEFWEKMLKSIADLQNYDARTITSSFGDLEEGEENELKLKDWILNVAKQMIEHGVGESDTIDIQKVSDAIEGFVGKSGEDSIPHQHWDDIKDQFIDKAQAEGPKMSTKLLEGGLRRLVKKNTISTKTFNVIKKALQNVDIEPNNYFEKDSFLNLIRQGRIEEAFDDEEVKNAERALDAFDSDEEWREALKDKVQKNVSLSVPKEEVIKEVDKLASKSGYKIDAGVKMSLTDENSIVAHIAAPFPFFYTFIVEKTQKLTLVEAAMVFFDREVFVTPDHGADSPINLLDADKVLAKALDNAVQFEMGQTTTPIGTETFSDKMSRMLSEEAPAE